MTEQQQESNQELEQEFNEVSEVERELSEVEQEGTEEVVDVKQKAKSTGHLTAEEYQAKHGSLKGYKTEEEFVRTGDMIEQIMSLKKKLDKRDNEVEAIYNYHRDMLQETKKKAKAELENRLIQAREYGNIEAIEALTAQKTRDEYTEQQEQLKTQFTNQQQVVEEFIERNKHWYNDNHPEAKVAADNYDRMLTQKYQRLGIVVPLQQLAQEVEDCMRNDPNFREIVNTGIVSRSVVSTPTRSTVNKSVNTTESDDRIYSKLNQDQKLMYQTTKRMLGKQNIQYSVKDFATQLKNDGEL